MQSSAPSRAAPRRLPLRRPVLRARTLASLLLSAVAAPAVPASEPSDAVVLRTVPLLFADDSGIAERHGLERTIHPGTRREQPVIVADQPWENQRAYMWGSVHYDAATGRLAMWYLGRLPITNKTMLQYATSTDGVTWTKPALGLHAVQGSTANNIVEPEGGGSATVLLDPFARRAEERYKRMVAHRGYRTAYSADGIRWTEYSPEPALTSGDTVMLAQHPVTGEFLAYHKRPATVRGFPRRVVWLSRSADFRTWSEPQLVFAPDEYDDAWCTAPEERTEVYVMSVLPHAAGYLGFPAMFRNTPQKLDGSRTPQGGVLSRAGGASGSTGPIDIQLTTSRDGVTWQRTLPRLAIIPRGAPGTYDGGAILNTASSPIDVGDQTWLYYTAIASGHGAPVPPKAISIGRAAWRLHGFASLDAGPEGGRLTTRPLRLGPGRLVVNADASRGRLRVALLEADGRPVAGCGFEEAVPLASDATRWPVRWQAGSVPTDRPVRVALELHSTRLYSLFVDATLR